MTLFNFPGGSGGWKPQGKLLMDAYGALYGVTYQGGTGTCTDSFSDVIGCGIVFQLTPPGPPHTGWTESVLHDFAGADDGIFPQGGLIADASGALIGTASGGTVGGIGGFGLVFKLTSPALRRGAWTETVLCQFDPSTTGEEPVGELVPDPDGHYFGATFLGGPQLGGSVFEITP
jgi:hypothetical protein